MAKKVFIELYGVFARPAALAYARLRERLMNVKQRLSTLKELAKSFNSRIEIKVTVLLSIVGFLLTIFVAYESLRTHVLEATIAAEQTSYDLGLKQRDRDIEAALPDRVDAPVPIYPHNRASLIKPAASASEYYTQLQWLEGKQQTAAPEYTVEVIEPAANGFPDFQSPRQHLATDPPHMASTISTFRWGWYFWRIKRGGSDSEARWSPFFCFQVFSTSKDRITKNKELRIGTFLAPLIPELSCPNPPGNRVFQLAFDDDLVKEICTKLANTLHFDKIRFVKYPTPDTLVFSGVKDGNVDLAISALSNTETRRELGVLFSNEYLPNHLVIVTRQDNLGKRLGDNERVGVVRGGTNAEFARELSGSKNISVTETESLEELLRILENKEVNFILVDEPIIDAYVGKGKDIVIIDHPTKGFTGIRNAITMRAAVSDANVGLAVAVHDQELQTEINKILTPELLDRLKDTLKNAHH